MISMSCRLTPSSDNITASVIDGEAIIVNLSTGVYYSMAETGGEVWSMVEEGRSLREMVDGLVAKYDASPEQAAQDLVRLAGELVKEEIVTVSEAGGGEPAPQVPAPGVRSPYVPPVLNVYRDMGDLLALDPPMPGLRDIPWQDAGEEKS
jgi:hypothetical protein